MLIIWDAGRSVLLSAARPMTNVSIVDLVEALAVREGINQALDVAGLRLFQLEIESLRVFNLLNNDVEDESMVVAFISFFKVYLNQKIL